jgi:hypothetical protein
MYSHDLELEADLPSDLYRRPRMRTVHIVLWILVTVAIFVGNLVCDSVYGRAMPRLGSVSTVAIHAVRSVYWAIVLVGAGTLVWGAMSGKTGRFQPGHWMVLNLAVVFLASLPLSQLDRVVTTTADLANVSNGVCAAISSSLFLLAVGRLLRAERWRKPFTLFVPAYLFGAAFLFASAFPPGRVSRPLVVCGLAYPAVLFCLLAGISFLRSVIDDVRTKRDRDSLHWFGVLSVAVPATIAAILLLPAFGLALWDIGHWTLTKMFSL